MSNACEMVSTRLTKRCQNDRSRAEVRIAEAQNRKTPCHKTALSLCPSLSSKSISPADCRKPSGRSSEFDYNGHRYRVRQRDPLRPEAEIPCELIEQPSEMKIAHSKSRRLQVD
jgi:YD repeat-containing protein